MAASCCQRSSLGVAQASLLLMLLAASTTAHAEERSTTLDANVRAILERAGVPIVVHVVYTNVPSELQPRFKRLNSMLAAMERALGVDRFLVTWHAAATSEGMRMANVLGIRPTTAAREVNGRVVKHVFTLGVGVEIGDRKPVLIDGVATSFRIGSSILEVIERTTTKRTVAVIGDSMNCRRAVAALERVVGLPTGAVETTLSLEKSLPKSVNALVIVAPRNLSQVATYHLEQYLLGGGHILLLLDPIDAKIAMAKTSRARTDSGLGAWLAHQGIVVNADCVGDDLVRGMFVVDGLGRYPYWPITTVNPTPGNPSAEKIEVLLRWPTSLIIDTKRFKSDQRRAIIVANTSAKGFRSTDLASLRTATAGPEDAERKVITLAVHMAGAFSSAFKTPPEGAEGSAHFPKGRGELTVFGDAAFATDYWLPGPSKGKVFQFLMQFNHHAIDSGFKYLQEAVRRMVATPELRAVLASEKPAK